MPVVNEVRYAIINNNSVVVYRLSKAWSTSPRKGSKLLLRPLPFTMRKGICLEYMVGKDMPSPARQPNLSPSGSEYEAAQDLAYAQAYARLRGKLYKGSGSLGVTLASYKQSRDMVASRIKTLRTDTAQLYVDAVNARRKGRDASSMILETTFGWAPLLQDAQAALSTVIQRADEVAFVRGAGTAPWTFRQTDNTGFYLSKSELDGKASCTLAASIVIDNPNKWLAERAGLLNVGAVAWDLVPWSFMVNRFVNTGAIVNSLTDFAGLTFLDSTRTIKWDFLQSNTITSLIGDNKGAVSASSFRTIGQDRTLAGKPASPPLIFKIPDYSWELAIIDASLLIQNLVKLKPLYTLGQMTMHKLRSKSQH